MNERLSEWMEGLLSVWMDTQWREPDSIFRRVRQSDKRQVSVLSKGKIILQRTEWVCSAPDGSYSRKLEDAWVKFLLKECF